MQVGEKKTLATVLFYLPAVLTLTSSKRVTGLSLSPVKKMAAGKKNGNTVKKWQHGKKMATSEIKLLVSDSTRSV